MQKATACKTGNLTVLFSCVLRNKRLEMLNFSGGEMILIPVGSPGGVEIHNMHNLVKHCVSLIRSSISQEFYNLASPNLVGRYYMTQTITFANGCFGNYHNHGNKRSY